MSGNARRESIVRAALPVFARLGRDGASTDEIARAAGVSQPYVIRLFGGKDALFLAVIDELFDRLSEALVVAQPAAAHMRLPAMLAAYRAVTEEPVLAHMVVQANAAAIRDEVVQQRVRGRIHEMHKMVWAAAGGDTDAVREFFGTLTLIDMVAALDVPELLGPGW
jgi:AcrR family transcriptional regulator